MSPARRWLLAGALALAGCSRGAQADYESLLAGKGHAYVGGPIQSAHVLATLEKRDFTYAIEIDRSGTHAAYTHLASHVYRLGLFDGGDLAKWPDPPPRVADAEICPNEFDVEGLAFSPDGTRVATAGRDMAVRLYDQTGKLLRTAFLEEPLASLAWSPDGRFLVAGSERGLVSVLGADDLEFGFDVRAHKDSVRALAFADDGTLFSAGWDKAVHAFHIAPQPRALTETHLHANHKAGVTGIYATVDGKAPALLTVDERNELVTLTPEAATRAGIDPGFLKDKIEELTPAGKAELPLARDRTLSFKNMQVPHVDIAICQACSPPGVDGVLGKQFSQRFEVVLDEAHQDVLLRAKDPAAAPTVVLPVLAPAQSFSLQGFVNDLTVSRDGTKLGIAMNEAKAERSLALYKREKAGDEEPVLPGNVAAIVDAKRGAVLEQHNLHHGVVASAAISPDGKSLASGGWDKKVLVFSQGGLEPVAKAEYGWAVRKVRFSPDGRFLAVGAWTPQNANDKDSDPAAQIFALDYLEPKVIALP